VNPEWIRAEEIVLLTFAEKKVNDIRGVSLWCQRYNYFIFVGEK